MNKITVAQAIELAGGESNLNMGYNFPLKRMISVAKDGDGLIDEGSFLRNLESCQGVAAGNTARNYLKNAATLTENRKKFEIREDIRSDRETDSGHHHFMP